MMAIMPHRNAEPDEAQAFSILIAGAGNKPAQLAAIGAVWAWCSYASLICPMKAALMSLLGSSFSTLWNADNAASAKSSRAQTPSRRPNFERQADIMVARGLPRNYT